MIRSMMRVFSGGLILSGYLGLNADPWSTIALQVSALCVINLVLTVLGVWARKKKLEQDIAESATNNESTDLLVMKILMRLYVEER